MNRLIFLAILLIVFSSCKKYLDKSPDKALTIPKTLEDFQQLLDNDLMGYNESPGFGDISSDDVYFSPSVYSGFDAGIQHVYTWSTNNTDAYNGFFQDWSTPYQAIFYANVVIDGLNNMEKKPSEMERWKQIMGSALFYRAFNFYSLEESFGQPYSPSSANNDLGIVLRLSSDVNETLRRATVKAVYDQITKDLLAAKDIVSETVVSSTPNRVNKAAVLGLLARVYLQMEQYTKAHDYADSALRIYNNLVDYNSLNLSNPYTFAPYGPDEVLFNCTELSYAFFPVDTTLYNLYADDDLRKASFFSFDGMNHYFIGSYDGSYNLFSGVATDEIYLIRAECSARANDVKSAMSDLNNLLVKRWKSGTFNPLTANDAEDALKKVLTERRKELLLRGLRWPDLRRLNQDPRFAITLSRIADSQTYSIAPNDPRYTQLIPQQEIAITGLTQNRR